MEGSRQTEGVDDKADQGGAGEHPDIAQGGVAYLGVQFGEGDDGGPGRRGKARAEEGGSGGEPLTFRGRRLESVDNMGSPWMTIEGGAVPGILRARRSCYDHFEFI